MSPLEARVGLGLRLNPDKQSIPFDDVVDSLPVAWEAKLVFYPPCSPAGVSLLEFQDPLFENAGDCVTWDLRPCFLGF